MNILQARNMKAIAVFIIGFLLAGVSASAATADSPDKVFVCKYVGTPGDGETLQTGNNPISVSVNAIPDYEGVGSYFSDQHGRSYVLALDNSTGGGQSGEPDISSCPAPDTGPVKVTPVQLGVVDQCGTENDAITGVPANGRYSAVAVDGNTQTVTFTPGEGETLGSPLPSGWTAIDGVATFSRTFTNEPCVSDPDPQFVTVLWQMNPVGTPPVFDPAQTIVDHKVTSTPELDAFDDQLVGKCVGFQVDVYKYTTEADKAAVDALISGGVLYGPNNPTEPLIAGGLGTAWKFYQNSDCAVEPVTVDMNLTYMTACSPDPTNTWRIRNSSDMPVAYTLEYYGQDVVASGTAPVGDSFVNLPRETATAILKWGGGESGIVAGSKTKASGVDQDCSIEVTAVAASVNDPTICGPNNDVVNIPTTEGVTYNDTGWVNNSRTITATANEGYTLVGEFEWTFTDEATICPVELTEVTPAEPSVTPICAANNDTVTIPTTTGVKYSDTGWVNNSRTITATAEKGYTLTGTTEWTFTDDAKLCPIEIVDATPVPPAVQDPPICGPNNNEVSITETEGVKYSDTGWVNNSRTITATAEEGYTLTGTTEWTFTDVPVAGCPDEPPVFSFTPKGELAYTGTSSSTGGIAGLALFLMTAGTFLVARRVRA